MISVFMIVNKGDYSPLAFVAWGFHWKWSNFLHTWGVSHFGKKNLKKSLECIRIILYLWGGGWAWFEYMLFYIDL